MTVFFLIILLTGLLILAAKVGINPVKTFRGKASVATGLTFIFTGMLHFLTPDTFMKLMPPFIPAPMAMIYISGFFEVLGGIGLLLPTTKRRAAYGLIMLLLAIFPANIYVALNNVQLGGFMSNTIYQWSRLPMQLVLIWWVWWTTNGKTKKAATE